MSIKKSVNLRSIHVLMAAVRRYSKMKCRSIIKFALIWWKCAADVSSIICQTLQPNTIAFNLWDP